MTASGGGAVGGARLHVVTGKGGTGKTTVAAALALALARSGRRVLLTEVENRQGIARLFDTPPLPYEERRVAVAPGGGDLVALAIDPEAALLDYLEMFYRIKSTGIAARSLRKVGAIDFATTIAPGMRDVLLTGKVKEAVVRRERGHPAYDAVVLDAPPTGRITRFLNVTAEVAGLARMGPIKTQSEGVMQVLRSPQTAVHLVTLLEEMPVQETADGLGELAAAGFPLGRVFVNMVREPLLPTAELDRAAQDRLEPAALARSASTAGLDLDERIAAVLVAEAGEHARRVALEQRLRGDLADLGRPVVELPLLPDAGDLACLYRLAGEITEQGAA
ncbi:MAG: ATPase [Actinomycetota bacterium]|nr:ATPase [Actinomycetota bacterium]